MNKLLRIFEVDSVEKDTRLYTGEVAHFNQTGAIVKGHFSNFAYYFSVLLMGLTPLFAMLTAVHSSNSSIWGFLSYLF